MPPAPAYDPPQPIPIVVGVELAESPDEQIYGSQVVNLLKEMKVFQYVIWPYNEATPVDAVLRLSITGSWEEGSTVTSAILVGLTLGLLGPFVGPKIKGNHDVTASVVESDNDVVAYSFHVETEVSRGLATNKDVVLFQADGVQIRKIATELAERLNEDREEIAGGSASPDSTQQ
jgi:hypothetical protein